ncbi:MAG: HipA domain-containing protein, partial [Arcobacteraceae bacterium]|nr:HipA domain-containing protein [Arcobacteraceae bacterium]
LNEYFCLKTIEKVGVPIPNIQLSKNNKFLIVEKFNYDKNTDTFFGFEEVLALLGKNKDEKYGGSYEQVAKVIYSVTTDKLNCMKKFFKVIIMNYLLKNGDAHLKNFGVLYSNDFKNIWFAPAYDVVTTTAYFHKDRPALTMFGRKVWFGKKELIKFGCEYCYLSNQESTLIYNNCLDNLEISRNELIEYISKNDTFKEIGNKMSESWNISLDSKTYKELPDEVTRTWN